MDIGCSVFSIESSVSRLSDAPIDSSRSASTEPGVVQRSLPVSGPVATPTLSGFSGHSNSGLGRSLEGILGDIFVADADSGLQHLLGGHHDEPVREVRQFVADTAVRAITAKFGAEAVWLATADASGSVNLISTHLPPSWSYLSRSSFEVAGRLWEALSGETGYSQASIEGQCLWLCSQKSEKPFAVAVIRGESFDPNEQLTLSRFLRSVSVAIGEGCSGITEIDISVSMQQRHQLATAEVNILSRGNRRTACAKASSMSLAIANAAASLCEVPCTVAYAGQVSLEQYAVAMAVVLDHTNAPLIGLSVEAGADPSGPARAVFASLASVSGQPFGQID